MQQIGQQTCHRATRFVHHHHQSSVVFCCRAGFWHPFSVSIFLSSAAQLSATQLSYFAKSCSIWILLPLVVFHPIVSQNMANPSMFLLPNRVQYLPVFVYSSENFFYQASWSFLFLSHFHISKASSLLSVWVNIHVFVSYSATFQTKHFFILFFSSRFIYP